MTRRTTAEWEANADDCDAVLESTHNHLRALAAWSLAKALKARNHPGARHKEQMEQAATIYEEVASRINKILETNLYEEES